MMVTRPGHSMHAAGDSEFKDCFRPGTAAAGACAAAFKFTHRRFTLPAVRTAGTQLRRPSRTQAARRTQTRSRHPPGLARKGWQVKSPCPDLPGGLGPPPARVPGRKSKFTSGLAVRVTCLPLPAVAAARSGPTVQGPESLSVKPPSPGTVTVQDTAINGINLNPAAFCQ